MDKSSCSIASSSEYTPGYRPYLMLVLFDLLQVRQRLLDDVRILTSLNYSIGNINRLQQLCLHSVQPPPPLLQLLVLPSPLPLFCKPAHWLNKAFYSSRTHPGQLTLDFADLLCKDSSAQCLCCCSRWPELVSLLLAGLGE
jgi:hypothetical protein